MSDGSQGPGWWMASDGKWYPPESKPGELPPPPAAPYVDPRLAALTEPEAKEPVRKFAGMTGKVWLILIVGVVVVAILGAISDDGKSGTPSSNGGARSEQTRSTPTIRPTILPPQVDQDRIADVYLHDVVCGPDEIVGKVKNLSPVRLDIYITVYEDDIAGVQLDDRLASVRDLAAGDTGRWSSRVLVDEYAACSIAITGIFDS